jgi:hypothetical protein
VTTGSVPSPATVDATVTTFDQLSTAGNASTSDAWALFDRLDTVDEAFMLGQWRGSGFPTGHPMDGLLEAYGWIGKRFENVEAVHPLVFASAGGRRRCVNPLFLLPFIGWIERRGLPRSGVLPKALRRLLPVVSTTAPAARLRVVRHRGRDSAAMLYDHLPVVDVFRRIDDERVLGVMDMRAMRMPFFFVLQREGT